MYLEDGIDNPVSNYDEAAKDDNYSYEENIKVDPVNVPVDIYYALADKVSAKEVDKGIDTNIMYLVYEEKEMEENEVVENIPITDTQGIASDPYPS